MRQGLPLRRKQMGMHQYQMKVEIHHQIHQSLGSPEKSHSTLKFTNHTWFNSILDTCFPITDGTIWIWEFASIFGRYCHTLNTSNCFYILLSAFVFWYLSLILKTRVLILDSWWYPPVPFPTEASQKMLSTCIFKMINNCVGL